MRINLHRPNQIGGCITEIESFKGTKIFIDLGHNLPRGDEEATDEYASSEAVEELTRGAKAIFYTHMHGDHIELFKYVPEGIDQYVGPLAHDIMLAKHHHMAQAQDLRKEHISILEKLIRFKRYNIWRSIKVNDITIKVYPVSHSSADSYMLAIRCDGKTILHTGDFRCHGYMGESIFDGIKKIKSANKVDVLITEGTNIDNTQKSMRPEEEIKEEFKGVFGKYKNTFVLCSSADADRLESVILANQESVNRPFIADEYQAEVLRLISSYAKSDSPHYHLNDQTYCYSKFNPKMNYMMQKLGFVMLLRSSEKFQAYLDKILKFCKAEETCLVYSMFHGYIDAEKPTLNTSTLDFVEQFRKKGCHVEEWIHTSGHASKQDLVRLCQQVNPRVIIPIHKDPQSDFKSILPEELAGRVCERDCCKDGVTIRFAPSCGGGGLMATE